MTPVTTVGIAGGTASGKTTLAAALLDACSPENATILPLDNYYIKRDHQPLEERSRANYDHPDALEFDLLVEHINALRSGHEILMPQYDFAQHTRSREVQRIEPRPVLIVEGILTLAMPKLRETFDHKVFVDSPDDLRLQRRLDRDVRERGRTAESVHAQWRETVQPMFEQYCYPSREQADLIVNGAEDFEAQIQEILERISLGA